MWHKTKSKGFTLIEVAVVSSILILVVGFLGYLSIKHFSIYNNQMNELNVASDARVVLDEVDNYVRGAFRVANSHDAYLTGPKTLVLQIPSIDALNQVIGGKYDYAAFYLTGDKLMRQVFPDATSSRSSTTKTLANGVDPDSFLFSYDNATYSLVKQVSTQITVKQGNSSYERLLTVSSTSFLRNY